MNLNIAVIGDLRFASQFGKKGTESDMTLFNFRRGEDTLTFLHPTRFPDRLSSLLFILEQCDLAIINISRMDAQLGEIIVAMDAAGIRNGYIYLDHNLQREQIHPLLAGMSMEKFTFTETPPPDLKEQILSSPAPPPVDGPTLVPIDHHFTVRGIGPVILGIVRRGTVKRHQKLILHPSEREVIVRSIQTHDRDVTTAGFGERVGLALKGIESEDLDRGMVLAEVPSDIVSSDTLTLSVTPNRFWKVPLVTDMVVHASALMQMRPGRVSNVSLSGGPPGHPPGVLSAARSTGSPGTDPAPMALTLTLTLTFDRPFTHRTGGDIFLSYLEGGPLRVIGHGRVISGPSVPR